MCEVVRSDFFETFGVLLLWHRKICDMIGEFFLYLPIREKGWFLWLAQVCAIMWDLWGEQNNCMFKGLERVGYLAM